MPRARAKEWHGLVLTTGFSLAEVTIVIACASILMAASVPNLYRLREEWSLWGGVHILESSLQWGRARAVTANTSTMLIIAGDGRSFYWADGYSGDKYEHSLCHLPGRIRIVGAPKRPLRFYQRGNAVPAGTFTLQGEVGQYRVIVNVGGRIRVQRD